MNYHKITWAVAFIALVIFMGLPSVYAGDPARAGTAGGAQLLVPVGGRSLALGGANAAYTEGLEAIYWNPAGLSLLKTRAAGTFSTMSIFNDIDVNYAAVAVKSGLGTVGFSIKAFDFGDIPVTTNEDYTGSSGETFNPTFITVGLTYSRRLTDAIQVGITGKLVSESIPRASASAAAFDIGIQYHSLGNIQGLSFGVAVKNIGTKMQYDGSGLLRRNLGTSSANDLSIPTSSHDLPATVELGVGYQRNINEMNTITVLGNFENANFGNDSYKLGAEYMYSDLIALRGGYLVTNNLDSEDQLYRFTLGVGLHYKLGGTDLTFDYAFRDSQYFDGNNMFQLTIGF